MMNELISIIMPVYKPTLSFLEKAVDSVLNQTHTNLELIIIYKKSFKESDKEVEAILESKKNDHRVRIIENDENFVYALNTGIKLSKGKIIGRMDSDDICVNTRFEEQMKFIRDSGISIAGSWVYSISDDGKIIGTIEPPSDPEDIRKNIMFHCPVSHSSISMKKEMLEKIGYYDPNFAGAEDYELYLRAISRGYKIANIPKYLIYIRETSTSIMRGNQWKSTRRSYIKAKNKAMLHYGFNRYYDIFYGILTPISLFITPKLAYQIKNKFGWYKNTDLQTANT